MADPNRYKIAVLGDKMDGKTALMTQICFNYIAIGITPRGDNCFLKNISIGGIPRQLEVWDATGQEYESQKEEQKLFDSIFQDCAAAVLVYGITSRQSFEHVRDLLSRMQKSRSIYGISRTEQEKSCPLYILANKDRSALEREVWTKEGRALAESFGCRFVEGSGMRGEPAEEVFFEVVSDLHRLRNEERGGASGRKSDVKCHDRKGAVKNGELREEKRRLKCWLWRGVGGKVLGKRKMG